ncbi:MAG TPA: sugar ABC transporter permease [Caldilineae bacterium]|nr:sugar ABC transporter permease [Caldilineae bacterium]
MKMQQVIDSAVTTIRRPRVSRLQRREWLAAALFIAPNMIGLVVFILGPVIAGFLLSFTKWDMLSPPEWIGLENYRALLFDDPLFWLTLKNTLYYTVLVIPIGTTISLGLALALNTSLKGVAIYRTIFFIPVVASAVAVAVVWKWVFQPDFGLLNALLRSIGIKPQGWLNDPSQAMPSVAAVAIWQGMGYNMVIFLAGLKGIPRHLYEAAALDGARGWQRFWYITLPLLTPTLFFVLIMSIISSFQVFAQVFVMTQGGPGNATRVYVYYLWENAFSWFKMGYASAMAYILFLIILVITILQVKFLGRRVQYELG